VGPRADTDGCGNFRNHRDSIPRPFNPQRVAIPTTPSRPTPGYKDKVEDLDQREITNSLSRVRHKHTTQRTSFNGATLSYKGLLTKPTREASCQWMKVYLCQEFDKRRMDDGTCI
jgi:hypothetical protein